MINNNDHLGSYVFIHDFDFPFQHQQDWFYFVLVLSGSLTVTIGEKQFDFVANDYFTINTDTFFSVIKSDKVIAYIFKIHWESLLSKIDSFENIYCNSKIVHTDNSVQLVKDFIQLIKDSTKETDMNHLLQTASTHKFLYTLSLFKMASDEKQVYLGVDDKFKLRIASIKQFLFLNYKNTIRLSDLANHLYLTPQYTSSFIKTHLGSTFHNMLLEIRITKAADDLIHTTNTLIKVAFENGFTNVQTFNKTFRSKFNMPPNQFRKLHQYNKKIKNSFVSNISIETELLVNEKLDIIMDEINDNANLFPDLSDILTVVDDTTISINKRVWQDAINLGFAIDILSNTFQKHIEMVQNNLHFRYGRIQGVIDSQFIAKIPNSNRFNFSSLNRVIDFMYSINILPFIEFGAKPQILNIRMDQQLYISDSQYTRSNTNEWEHFYEDFINNCINRYGKEEVSKWKFEMWLPHEEKMYYLDKRIDEYIVHYNIMYKTIKGKLPKATIGGSGFNALADYNMIKTLINKLAQTESFFDFFSFVCFFIELTNDMTAFLTSSRNYLNEVIKNIKAQIHPYKLPLYLTEFTYDVTSRNYMHDSVYEALFIVDNIVSNHEQLESIAFWNLTDLSAEYKDINTILFGGNGMVSVDGLKKPVFYAYKFLSYLGNNVIEQGKNHIITSKGNDSYQIMVFNYAHPSPLSTHTYTTDFGPESVNEIFINESNKVYNITIKVPVPGRYRVKSYLLNKNSGSVIDEWTRIGTNIQLEKSELDYIQSISIPKQNLELVTVETELNIRGLIKPNEIKLYRIKLEL